MEIAQTANRMGKPYSEEAFEVKERVSHIGTLETCEGVLAPVWVCFQRPLSSPDWMVNDTDNDNDTLREVPHPSNEGLALQARV